jgi:DNA-binding HxlR family transcriptional regulator
MGNTMVRKTRNFIPGNCPVGYCMNIIGGKWKPSIIHMIRTDRNRYSILLKNITELESDGIIERIIFPEIPPRVEYNITPYGNSLLPIIDSMYQWARQNMPNMPTTNSEKDGYCDEKQ